MPTSLRYHWLAEPSGNFFGLGLWKAVTLVLFRIKCIVLLNIDNYLQVQEANFLVCVT